MIFYLVRGTEPCRNHTKWGDRGDNAFQIKTIGSANISHLITGKPWKKTDFCFLGDFKISCAEVKFF